MCFWLSMSHTLFILQIDWLIASWLRPTIHVSVFLDDDTTMMMTMAHDEYQGDYTYCFHGDADHTDIDFEVFIYV